MWLLAFPPVPGQYRGNQVGCPDPFQSGGKSTPFPRIDTLEKGRPPRSVAESIAKVSEVDWAQQLLQHYSLSEN